MTDELKGMTDIELQVLRENINEERRRRSKKTPEIDNEDWNAEIEIRNEIGGKAQIFINGRRVPNVLAYKLEQDCHNNRIPLLTMQVRCNVSLESTAIPVLPEPWSWFYKPKYNGFTSPDEVDG